MSNTGIEINFSNSRSFHFRPPNSKSIAKRAMRMMQKYPTRCLLETELEKRNLGISSKVRRAMFNLVHGFGDDVNLDSGWSVFLIAMKNAPLRMALGLDPFGYFFPSERLIVNAHLKSKILSRMLCLTSLVLGGLMVVGGHMGVNKNTPLSILSIYMGQYLLFKGYQFGKVGFGQTGKAAEHVVDYLASLDDRIIKYDVFCPVVNSSGMDKSYRTISKFEIVLN